ncbi:MAG: hypothetical protein K8W52_37665 [Deltaproteobacteria bacterium]|nr:hypothetical protein [Deltaproteobacteria bacterium]
MLDPRAVHRPRESRVYPMRGIVVGAAMLVAGCSQVLGIDDLHVGGVDARPGVDAVDAQVVSTGDAAVDGATSTACDRIDLLFVIDDSGSMAEEQANLATNIPAFIDVLDTAVGSSGAPLDYHLGFTTTGRDVSYSVAVPGIPPITQTEQGDDGELRGACGLDRKWLARGDASAASIASCRAQVGTAGPSLEMPLYATRLATNERVVNGGPNAGFLRATAPLVVVVLTDEDDCSREDNNFTTDANGDACQPASLQAVTAYRDYLDLLKGRHDLWSMAIVADNSSTMCSSPFGTAVPASRLMALQAASPDNVVTSSICSGNLALALADVLDVVQRSCAR